MANRLALRLTALLASFLLLSGCTEEETVRTREAALTPGELRTIHFEQLSDWHRFSGTGTLASSTNHSEGAKSVAVSGMGYIAVRNLTPLTKDDQQTPQVVGYDIWIPVTQPNPTWHGDTQLTIDAPSAGVYQQYLGYRSLQTLPKGQWVHVEFPVPNAIRTALNAANYTDLRVIIGVNVPPGASTHYLDNFTLGPVQTSCTPVSDNNVCTSDTCNPSTGQTIHTPVAPGTSCTDANACNGAEVCNATGVCQAGPPPTVDDGNACTADSCSASGGVTHTPVSAGTSCTDGNACNGAEVCNATSACLAGTPPTVDDGNACTADACSPTGGVTHLPVSAGTSCADSNACNGVEACNATGVCQAGTPPTVDDGNACTADACSASGGVTHTPVSAGTSCADTNVCNGAEVCSGTGACQAGTPPAIDDGNVCTADACSPSGGVTHTPVSAGTSCTDGNSCNGAEACNATGACQAGTPVVVDDGNACTADACSASGGVTHTPVSAGTSCADGNACDGQEVCNAVGVCLDGTAPGIDDGNPCTADACDAASGVTHTPLSAGQSCTDGNFCNGDETCNGASACVAGAPASTDDGNPCTADACDPVNGVTHAAAAAGSACEDGDLCNGTETCSASGVCTVGTPLTASADENPCVSEVSCDAETGLSWDFEPVGTSCAVGFICDGEGECLRDQGGGTLPPPLPPGVGQDISAYALTLPRDPTPGCALAPLNPEHVAIIAGRVLTWDEATGQQVPVVGARVSVPRKCGAGTVVTLEDGAFMLPIEGGYRHTLRVEADANGDGTFDYLPAERSTETPWRGTAGVDPIELIFPAEISGTIDLDDGMVMEDVVLSGPTTADDRDGDGIVAPRTPSLLLKAGTTVSGVDANGAPVALDAAALRITEYTVGPTGLARMPAALPPGTAYGYAMELSIEGARHATFDQPAVYYVDNFLGAEAARSGEADALPFQVGLLVPIWYYNDATGAWEREDDGIIVRLVGVDTSSPALALIDADNDGDADFDDEDHLLSLGFELDLAEKEQLAAEIASGRRTVGDELWRTEVHHLSPRDYNWLRQCGALCGVGALLADGKVGGVDGRESIQCGSQVNVETMSLSEHFPIAGTGHSLNYNSRTVYGYAARRQRRVDRTPPFLPFLYRGTTEFLAIAGKTMHPEGCDSPGWGECYEFEGYSTGGFWLLWDGLNADGQVAYGTHRGLWYSSAEWGADLFRVSITRMWPLQMTVYDAKLQGLGGWTLSPHHYYDADGALLFRGDGHESTSGDRIIEKVFQSSGDGNGTGGLQVSGDGSIVTASPKLARLNLETQASQFVGPYSGGLPFVADGPDRVYSANPTYGIGPLSPPFSYLYSSERGPVGPVTIATYPTFAAPISALAMGPDQLVYALRRNSSLSLHRFTRDLEHADGGMPRAILPGDPGNGFSEAKWSAMTFYGDTLYLAVGGAGGIYRLDPADAEPVLVANLFGTLEPGQAVSTIPGTNSSVQFRSLRVTGDGIFFTRLGDKVIWRIDSEGILHRVAGSETAPQGAGDGGPALNAGLGTDISFDIAPDGSMYVETVSGHDYAIHHIRPATPGVGASVAERQVPSEDGTEVYEVSAEGRHLRTRSVLTGDVLRSFEYEAGLLSAIVEGDSEDSQNLPTTRIHRDPGDIVRIEAPSGQTTTLELDPATGYAKKLIDPAGSEVRFTHDAGGLLREMKDERGFVHSYGYDEFGRLISDTSPGLAAQTLSGWPLRGITHTNGENEQSSYDVSFNEETRALSRKTLNSDGSWVTLSRDDDLNRIQSYSDGTVVSETFDAHPTLGVVAPTWTSRTTALPSGLALAETHSLSLAGNTWNETHVANGRMTSTETNALERTITSTTPQGRTLTITLDEQGRPSTLEQGDLEPVFLTYDDQGRLSSMESGGGSDLRSTILEYFPQGTGLPQAGYLQSVTDAASQSVSFTRDAFGRALSATSGSDTTQFGFTKRGQLEQVKTPNDDSHLQIWNGVSLLTDYVAPAITGVDDLLENSYDQARRLSRTTLPGNILLDVTRDGLDPDFPERQGRLRSVASPNSGSGTSPFEVAFAYADEVDPPGPPAQLLSLTRGAISTEFTWDGFLPVGETNRIASGSGTGLRRSEVNLTWNADLVPQTETVEVGTDVLTASFGYDQDTLLTCAGSGASCDASNGVTYQFDSGTGDAAPDGHGLLEGITSGAVQETWIHSSFGELASRQVNASGSEIFSISYERDAVGRITRQTTTRGAESVTTEYEYDAKGQLVTVTADGADPLADPVRSYKYDPNGNRLCVTEEPLIDCAEEAVYDSQDRLREYDGATYTYTDRGTLHQRADGSMLETFTYDALGNLTRVARTGAPDIDYVIDAQGRRIGKQLDGSLSKQYVWSSALRVAAEVDDSGDLVSRFIYGNSVTTPDLVVRRATNGAAPDRLYRVIADHLGSPIYAVNIADPGDVWLDATYDEWGNVTAFVLDGVDQGNDTAAWPIPQGFAGGLFDADTKLVRFGVRDYDPRVGRWTAKDPILFGGGQGNLYGYVGNDPLNLVDPPGLVGVTVSLGAGFAAGFGTGFVPVGGGGGSIGFFVGTEGFGMVKSVHYTNGVGAYAGAGLSFGAYHSLDRLGGYSVGGKVVAGTGLIGGGTIDFTPDGKFAAAALDIGGGAARYAGGTLGATSVSNWYEQMREFFLGSFRRSYPEYEEPCE